MKTEKEEKDRRLDMKDNSEKKIIISVEIPENLREKLRCAAFEERLTLSALIRKILTEQINARDSEVK